MFIWGIGLALPETRYPQKDCWTALQNSAAFPRLSHRSHALLRKVLLGDNGIEFRHLALNPLSEAFELNPDALHARFARHAPQLASNAARAALEKAGLSISDIDAVLVSTCTGYLCPGLTSYVSEQLGLKPDVIALDLVGQGCGAALPNLRTADALLAAGRARHVLSICVEVCSAAFYLDEDPGVLISACLFGDGAAAAVLANEPHPSARRVEWKSCESHLNPADRDYLRFEQRGGMLRNILTKQVPSLAAKSAETLLLGMADRAGISTRDISGWILHAGGKEILNGLRDRLSLPEENLQWSRGVLRERGNVSSPSVLFALQAALEGGAPGGTWWMSSFGAGFSCHGAFLQAG